MKVYKFIRNFKSDNRKPDGEMLLEPFPEQDGIHYQHKNMKKG